MLYAAPARFTAPPTIIAGGGYVQHPTHQPDRILPHVFADQGVLYSCCLAKYAAAFFKNSFSFFSVSSSRFNCRTFSLSSLE
ncbi:MAG: hypothetical protein CVV11_02645 [Gammaproteobacteria bacterium HGW-Gammaproteobacteria-15]|nr:MAG: hypothetical protein CVV11_02645 [Gammaproteobacteria bacterium HGW-Gammaproteobacteria-15]